ncbi:hypothetical protein BDW59DRAFT_128307 [Aspergillus cavernicola]|uniref:RING-type domain-containing protein n=1 Tax=Aspergillus cavernicola TaxID=176166 RepID=A0ABR4HSH5_9EURO
MASGFQHTTMPDPNFQNPPTSGQPIPIDYMGYYPPLNYYGITSPNSNGQAGLSMPPYSETASGHGYLPSMDNITFGYSTLPPATSSNFAHTTNPLDNVSTTPLAGFDTFGEFARQWSNMTQSAAGQPTVGAQPSYQYYSPTATQPIPHGPPPFTAPYMEGTTTIPYTHDGMQHPPTQGSVVPNTQSGVNAGVSAANLGATPQLNRRSLMFPQSGASTGSAHQRRGHSRANTLTYTPQSPASGHQRIRSNNQSSRGRGRPASMAAAATTDSVLWTQLPPSPGPRNQVSTGTMVDSAPATRSTERSGHQPAQQAASFARNSRLTSWLRSLPPNEVQMLYEQSVGRGARLDPGIYVSPSYLHKKSLDLPKQSRPEPKETEELTLNMECKICMSQLVDTVLLPCGHATLCRWCADQHIPSIRGQPKEKANCPMCREPVRLKHRIYFP